MSSTYAGRRQYIGELARPVRDKLDGMIANVVALDPGPAQPDWPGLERRLDGLHAELAAASTPDDLQDVGRRAREILIDLANLVYRDDMLPTGETEQPKAGDAKNRLAQATASLFPGSGNEALRRLIRACWDLANVIAHSASIQRTHALASAQATILLVRTFEYASATPSGQQE